MRDRTSLVLELISNPKAAPAIAQALLHYVEPCESHLAVVCKLDVLAALKLFEKGDLSAAEIQAWAASLSGRTEIGFEFGADGVVEESLYWLAYPELNSPVGAALHQRIVALYERRNVKRDAC